MSCSCIAAGSQCQLVSPPNRKCSFVMHIPPLYVKIQLSATVKSCRGDGGWTIGYVSFFVPRLHETVRLSVCAHKLAKIAVQLRVEFTLEPLFAPPETRSLAPSFLPFALCHQSPTVSKNSSIVIVTDLPRFSEPPPCRTQEAASHVLFICLG